MEKQKKFNQRGITLVALVITIILLLILAGITISSLTNSGLFENAKLAEQKSKEAQEKEEGILGDYENKIGQYVGGNRDSSNTSKKELIFSGSATELNQTYTLSKSIEDYDMLLVQVVGYWSTPEDGNYRSFSSMISTSDNPYLYKSVFNIGGSPSYDVDYELYYGIKFTSSNTFIILFSKALTWESLGITNIYGIKM